MKIRIRPSKISTNPCISDKIVTFIQILIWPFIDIWIQRCYHVIMRSGGGGAGVTWSHDNSPEPVLPPSAVPASATGASTVQFGKTIYIIRSIWTLCIMLLDLLSFQSLVLLLCCKLNVFIHSNGLVCEVSVWCGHEHQPGWPRPLPLAAGASGWQPGNGGPPGAGPVSSQSHDQHSATPIIQTWQNFSLNISNFSFKYILQLIMWFFGRIRLPVINLWFNIDIYSRWFNLSFTIIDLQR